MYLLIRKYVDLMSDWSDKDSLQINNMEIWWLRKKSFVVVEATIVAYLPR